MRKFFSLITAVLFAGSMMATVVTFDPSAEEAVAPVSDTQGAAVSVSLSGVELSYTGSLNPSANPPDFRVFGGQTLTLSAEDNITKVVIAGKANKAGWAPSVDAGVITTGISYSEVTTKSTLEDPLFVVEDINEKSITITCNKQLRAYLIEVTTEGGDPKPIKITLVAGPWNKDGAQFAAATLNEVVEDPQITDLASADFSEFFVEESEGVFVGEVPATTKMIAFGRFSENATTPITALTLMGTDFLNHSDILQLDESHKYTITSMGSGLNESAEGYWGEDEVNYYLVGSFNGWTKGDAYQFSAHPTVSDFWVLNTTLEEGAEFMVVGVHTKINQAKWYPSVDMEHAYVVDADHAGDVTITFRPDGAGGEGWYEGYFFVEPKQAGDVVDVTINSGLIYVDAIASEGYWDLYGANDKFALELSNINEITEAPGTYTADDLDPEYSYIVDLSNPLDTITFVDGSIVLAIPAENMVTVNGKLTGNDGKIYNLNLTYTDPVAERTVEVTISEGELYDEYASTYNLYILYGTSPDDIYVQLEMQLEDFPGDFTGENLVAYLYGSLVSENGEYLSIFSADGTIVAGQAEGTYKLTADILCYNNTLYKVTMLIGDYTPVEDGHYYLAGSMNSWGVNPDYQFSVNPANADEYMLRTNLSKDDQFKVAFSEDDQTIEDTNWFPTGWDNNYVVDAEHAGDVIIYFRPDGNEDWESFHEGGFFFVQVQEPKDYYDVAEAIAAVDAQEVADGDEIAVRGIITKIQIKGKNFAQYHSACIYVKDATGAEGEFEYFNCVSLGGAIFASSDPAHDATSTTWANLNSLTDENGLVVAVGDEVIAKGPFKKYNTTYELNQGCQLIKVRDITEGIEDIVATGAAAKVLRNNQILILKGDKVYNVMGTVVR